ncbi:hypothetical protein C8Q76DRAFT_854142 [Earliella scabrosa]|nr:hypothetical protein C8Q76DRAFT_854142 [Earliella scabrosa]
MKTLDLIRTAQQVFYKEKTGMSNASVQDVAAAAAQLLAGIREHLNAQLPIHRLPTEILISIMLLATEASSPNLKLGAVLHREEGHADAGPLLAVTHVCRNWRSIALACPALWTRIDDHNLDQLQVFLHRSQAVPISLELSSEYDKFPDIFNEHGARLTRLDLTISFDFPMRLLSFHAPELEVLTISVSTYSPYNDGRSLDHPFILFREQVSSLRALALEPVTLWMPNNEFPHLTHLYLSYYAGYSTPNMMELSSLLGRMPNVEILHLSRLFDFEDLHSSHSWPAITLNRLRLLTIASSPWAHIAALVSQLDIPSSTPISIVNMDDSADFAGELPVTSVGEGLTDVEIVARENQVMAICESDTRKLLVCGFLPGESCAEWLTDRMHPVISLSSVNVLQIAPGYNGPGWCDLLDNLPRLQELRVCHRSRKTASGALHVLFSKLASGPLIVCPALVQLSIEARLDAYTESRLVAMLSARVALGHPIRRLAIQPYPFRAATAHTSRTTLWLQNNIPAPTEFEPREWDAEKPLCPWIPRAWWNVDDVEQYWLLADDEKPEYLPPPRMARLAEVSDTSGSTYDGEEDEDEEDEEDEAGSEDVDEP